MDRPIVNIDDLEYFPWGHGDRYEARIGRISPRIGAQKLGYNITVLPPGKRAYPFHSHRVNEEMFFILEGSGMVRLGADEHAIRQGDVIACPPCGPEMAHQILNTSETAELRYLAVSTRLSPEIAEYPDSGKAAIYAELPAGPDGSSRSLRFVARDQASMADYWEGE
ncbi:MAG: cupin domain-containing protein [Candidatus Schekmanbacteria bacterium]|nr:cupin domain-containing protein [Candidatus Schekmanbacteria bacterium]